MVVVRETFTIKKKQGLGLKCKLSQRPGSSLLLAVQTAESVEDFFRQKAHETGEPDTKLNSKVYQGVYLWPIMQGNWTRTKEYDLYNYNEAPLNMLPGQSFPRINLSFLRARGISRGVEIEVAWPLGAEEFNTFRKQIGSSFISFYASNLVPREVELQIDLTEIS